MNSCTAKAIKGMASALIMRGCGSHESCFMIRLTRASGISSMAMARGALVVTARSLRAKKLARMALTSSESRSDFIEDIGFMLQNERGDRRPGGRLWMVDGRESAADESASVPP